MLCTYFSNIYISRRSRCDLPHCFVMYTVSTKFAHFTSPAYMYIYFYHPKQRLLPSISMHLLFPIYVLCLKIQLIRLIWSWELISLVIFLQGGSRSWYTSWQLCPWIIVLSILSGLVFQPVVCECCEWVWVRCGR